AGHDAARDEGVARRRGLRQRRVDAAGPIDDGEAARGPVDLLGDDRLDDDRAADQDRHEQDGDDEGLGPDEHAELGRGDDADLLHGGSAGPAILTKMSCSDGRTTSNLVTSVRAASAVRNACGEAPPRRTSCSLPRSLTEPTSGMPSRTERPSLVRTTTVS